MSNWSKLEDSELPSVKTLGVRWNASEDIFTFIVKEINLSFYAKRGLLSNISKTTTLNTQNKWVEEKRKFIMLHLVMVLMVHPGNARGRWHLGCIQEVFPGPDRKVRVVHIRTAGKDYVRPITKLCPLEL